MKTHIPARHSWIWLSSLLLLASGCATTRVEVPGTMKVQVNVPPSWGLLIDDHVADAFVDRMREVFHHEGFRRPIESVRYVEDPARVPYLVTINLTDWRITRTGNVDCTFTATLRTPTTERRLGVYTNTTMRWLSGPGRFGLAQAFEDAAEGAIRDLCRDIAATELLPDLRRQA